MYIYFMSISEGTNLGTFCLKILDDFDNDTMRTTTMETVTMVLVSMVDVKIYGSKFR